MGEEMKQENRIRYGDDMGGDESKNKRWRRLRWDYIICCMLRKKAMQTLVCKHWKKIVIAG